MQNPDDKQKNPFFTLFGIKKELPDLFTNVEDPKTITPEREVVIDDDIKHLLKNYFYTIHPRKNDINDLLHAISVFRINSRAGLPNNRHEGYAQDELLLMLNKMGSALLTAKEALANDKSTDGSKKILEKAIDYCTSVVEHTLDILNTTNDKLYEIYEKEENTLKSQIISECPRPPL